MADQDESVFVSRQRRALVSRRRIDAPLEDAERDMHGAWDTAVSRAKVSVTRVDERRPFAYRGPRLGRGQSMQPSLGRGKDIVDSLSLDPAILPR